MCPPLHLPSVKINYFPNGRTNERTNGQVLFCIHQRTKRKRKNMFVKPIHFDTHFWLKKCIGFTNIFELYQYPERYNMFVKPIHFDAHFRIWIDARAIKYVLFSQSLWSTTKTIKYVRKTNTLWCTLSGHICPAQPSPIEPRIGRNRHPEDVATVWSSDFPTLYFPVNCWLQGTHWT